MKGAITLETKNLTAGYLHRKESIALFSHLNLTLRAGELVSFMGPNGIGKSTLIRTIAGLQKPLDGAVEFSNSATTKQIAVVLTDKIQATNLTALELITYGRYPYLDWNIELKNDDLRIIEESIALTRTEHLINKKLYELSDGQLQLVLIARALAQQTPILLLDEPTAHLDLNNRVEIMNLLRRLSREKNKAILIASHELDLALQTSDTIWIAGKDQTIITGIPEDLVLSGVFDEIFQFKGFDLKTGKVFHEEHRQVAVQLHGEGHAFLWTKNALERSGYTIDTEAPIIVGVREEREIIWQFNQQHFHSIAQLLVALDQFQK